MPLPRVWGFLRNWQKHPPMHRLFAMFLDYKSSETTATAPQRRFQIDSQALSAISGGRQRQACRQSQLDANTRKRVSEFQATPAYQEFKKNWRSKLEPRKTDAERSRD